jgi:hypothetical protein
MIAFIRKTAFGGAIRGFKGIIFRFVPFPAWSFRGAKTPS